MSSYPEYLRKVALSHEQWLAMDHLPLASAAQRHYGCWVAEIEENLRLNRRILQLLDEIAKIESNQPD